MRVLSQLLPRWNKESCLSLPAESEQAVCAAFQQLGHAATSDVIALFGALGGMQMFCDSYWRLWSLEEIAAQKPSEAGVLFSDYLMSCWEYRLKPVSDDCSAVFVDHADGQPPQRIAISLEDFLLRYANDAESLLCPIALPPQRPVPKVTLFSKVMSFFRLSE